MKRHTNIESVDWFHQPAAVTAPTSAHLPWPSFLIGFVIGGLVFAFWSKIFGAVILSISALVLGISIASPQTGAAIAGLLQKFGALVGYVVGVVLLTPLFILGFPFARLFLWLRGDDPLRLKDSDVPSFWLPSVSDRVKVRYARSMFASDPRASQPRHTMLALLLVVGMMLGVSEAVLRVMGFGNPVIYQADPQVGFMTKPNQNKVRYGGRVMINSFGMRGPEFEEKKPTDALRIFMIGDSTLYAGSYIDQPEMYARLVEARLAKKLNRNVEVLSMGVNKWGPFHKLGYVEKYGSFDSDIAMICLPIGDIYRPHYGDGEIPFRTKTPTLALEELTSHLKWRVGQYLNYATLADPNSRNRNGEVGIQAYVDLIRQFQESGCEVFVEVLPSQSAGTTGQVSEKEEFDVQRLAEAIKTTNAHFGFPAGLLKDKAEDRGPLYHDVCHLHVGGHDYYSDYLCERLIQDSRVIESNERETIGGQK